MKTPAERHYHPIPSNKNMSFLYVTEQGAVVRKSGDRILIDNDGHITLDLPYHKVESVLLFGNVQLTGAAMTELLDHNVTLSLFTNHGRFRGSLAPPAGKNVPMRVAQFDAYRDAERSFEIARTVVSSKLNNAITVLESLARKHGQSVEAALNDLRAAVQAAGKTAQVQSLDGVEGAAAHAYFSALMTFNKSEFPWPGRQKHPAPDPVNALLSLAYTLIMHELMGLAEAAGLDAYLGFLHQLDYGRPSLALDLVEAFRHPVADRFVLAILNQGIFKPADFYRDRGGEGIVLRPESLKRFFAEYEQWMLRPTGSRPAYRQSLRTEIELLVRHFRDGAPWTPFDAGHVKLEEN